MSARIVKLEQQIALTHKIKEEKTQFRCELIGGLKETNKNFLRWGNNYEQKVDAGVENHKTEVNNAIEKITVNVVEQVKVVHEKKIEQIAGNIILFRNKLKSKHRLK